MQRRVEQLAAEGVELRCGVEVGRDVTVEELRERFDAVVLATGSRVPRDLPVPGPRARRRALRHGLPVPAQPLGRRSRIPARRPSVAAARRSTRQITAAGKDVVVIGGGDTGADCVGNALREGARSIVQLELLPEPPAHRPDDRTPWPEWPLKYRLSYAMEEARKLGLRRAGLLGRDDRVRRRRQRRRGGPADRRRPSPSRRSRRWRAPSASCPPSWCCSRWASCTPSSALLDQLGVEHDARGNISLDAPYTSSVDGVFAAGDARRGQSLIVWAINEGRQCARMVDRYLARARSGQGAAGGHASRDAGIAGHADADEGPEGPPQHVGPGIGASES